MIIKYSKYIKESLNDNQFFKTYEETKDWLDNMKIQNYTINDDLTVDVNDEVFLINKNLTYLPVKFGIVQSYFYCHDNKLTTLKGSPKVVDKSFSCHDNLLTSLIGLPKMIKGFTIYCYNNPLTSLDGLSIYNMNKCVGLTWYTDLKPKIKEEYFDKHLEDNPEIISLIDFETTKEFKDKWKHLLNANKFDLI